MGNNRNWKDLSDEDLLDYAREFVEENKIEGRFALKMKDDVLYTTLHKRDLLKSEEFNEILPSKLRNWKDLSDEDLLDYARKFVEENKIDSRLVLQREDNGLYTILHERDLLKSEEFNEILPRIRRVWSKYNDNELLNHGKKFIEENDIESITQLRNEDAGLYKILYKRGLLNKMPFYKDRYKQEMEIPEESLLEEELIENQITNFNPDDSKASLLSLLMSTVPSQNKERGTGRYKTEKREYRQKNLVKIEYIANGETFDVTEEYTLSDNQFLLPLIWKKLRGLRGKELKELAETEEFKKFAEEYSTTQTFIETNIISKIINNRLGKKISIGSGTGADLTPEDIGFEINPVFAEIAKERGYSVINKNAAEINYTNLKEEGYEAVYFPQSLTDILSDELDMIVDNITNFDKIAFTLPHKNNIPDGLIERFGLRDESKVHVKIEYTFDDETKKTKRYEITILEPYSGPKKLKGAVEELELSERNRISKIIHEIANGERLYFDNEDNIIREDVFELSPREIVKILQTARRF